MWNLFVPSKKTVAIAVSLGLAGLAGVCGCKSSRSEYHCCRNYTPITVGQPAMISQPAGTAQDPAPQRAPPAANSTTETPYEEPGTSPQDTVAHFEALGGIVELDPSNQLSLLDLSQTKIGDSDLQDGAGLAQLRQLDLSNTQITDAALRNPNWLRHLKRLSLNNTLITDAGLSALNGLNHLQLLWLNETAVSDAGLAHLAGLIGIESLGLNKTEVTDAGLVHLQKMKGLKYLLLGHTQVTDAGLQHLKGFSELKGLSLVDSPVTAAGVAELQEALPDCQIIFETKVQEQRDDENDPETSMIPRRLSPPDQVVRHALDTSQETTLPTERFPAFSQQGSVPRRQFGRNHSLLHRDGTRRDKKHGRGAAVVCENCGRGCRLLQHRRYVV